VRNVVPGLRCCRVSSTVERTVFYTVRSWESEELTFWFQ
jgi:hypothetical protein